jgi:signal peptidase I
VYVLGDNRDNSRDSRFWGTVPIEDVRGAARVVYFSMERDEEPGPWRIRWDRIGRRLE